LLDAESIRTDTDGVKNCLLQTAASGLSHEDFVADISFRFDPNEQSIFHVGLAGAPPSRSGWEVVGSRVHGPGYGGYATLNISGQDEKSLGNFVTAGPHVFRMEKHGDMLTMSVGNIEENEFKPYFQKSILNLKTAAPFLARQNCSVFIST